MIARTNMDVTRKALANLLRIVLYLILYIHVLGCYWWQIALINAPIEYIQDSNQYEINGIVYNCTYRDSNDVVYNITATSNIPK